MAPLLACPFCRQLFNQGEAQMCPECDMPLKPLDQLPPSYEVAEQQAAEWEATAPEHRTLPWAYLRRGRGALLALCCLGIALFFSPWIEMRAPTQGTLSGFDLARRGGWHFLGGAVGYFVLLPIALTRRTLVELRGVRAISALFCGLTASEILMLWLKAPTGSGRVPVEYSWSWGTYLSFAVSLLGTAVAVRLGGNIRDLPADFGRRAGEPRSAARTGEILH